MYFDLSLSGGGGGGGGSFERKITRQGVFSSLIELRIGCGEKTFDFVSISASRSAVVGTACSALYPLPLSTPLPL